MTQPPEFKVIIAGSRDFDDYKALCSYADKMLSQKAQDGPIVIVSGGCEGADLLGERYARERGHRIEPHGAEWKKYGRYAGPKRNKEMALCSHALIAFWDGKSKGTKNMIDEARAAGLPVRVYQYKKGWRD